MVVLTNAAGQFDDAEEGSVGVVGVVGEHPMAFGVGPSGMGVAVTAFGLFVTVDVGLEDGAQVLE